MGGREERVRGGKLAGSEVAAELGSHPLRAGVPLALRKTSGLESGKSDEQITNPRT